MSLESLLQEGLDSQVYPLCRLEVFHRDQHVLSHGNADPTCQFDLASVTKVMSTTALVLDQQLAIESPLQRWLPTAAANASLADLMFHRSGLPPFLCWFEEALTREPGLFTGLEPELRERMRRHVAEQVVHTAPVKPVGTEAVYSDIGFILLGLVLETASGMPLDRLFATRIATPLGLSAGYRRISSGLTVPPVFAPTGATRPREHAPGQETMWKIDAFRPTGLAQVDDDNAFCLDGVSGHAGLFGTALDVARFGQAMLEGRWAPSTPWGRDTLTPGSTRALGFDTPSTEGASCGQRFGRAGPKGAIGHLGFTGTSVWIDLDRQLVVAFLTNRVALGRANVRIREFRPRVHDAVLDALQLS